MKEILNLRAIEQEIRRTGLTQVQITQMIARSLLIRYLSQ